MTSEYMPHGNERKPGTNWIFIGFFLIAGFFLFTEHRAHLLGALPFVLLALCPLLHIFGHGEHDHGTEKGDKP